MASTDSATHFALTAEPIREADCDSASPDPSAGAVVSFTGRVRHSNLGRHVQRLEYEGAEEIARNEFARIAAETRERFEITGLHCTHRVGVLEIGEAAVHITVTAPHRAAAFDACRYVLDELKQRLPIWKKEHYTDGDSGWINNP